MSAMRWQVLALSCAGLVFAAVAMSASADDGISWRRTSSRVALTRDGGALDLLVPRGRARGARSDAIAIVPGGRYRASVELDVAAAVPRGAFLRVALYRGADGRGRQRLILDSAFATADGPREVAFAAPSWARAARLRILARPDRASRIRARGASLAGERDAPEVVLREGE